MKTLLREPLLHFLLLAFLFFIAFDFLNPAESNGNVIEISEGRVAQLKQRFQKTWQRSPSEQETANLIRNYALDEIYNREARALGLDKNDSIVKKRMRQKMEFMLQDTIPQQPEREELEAYFEKNKDKYRVESRFNFEQLYVSVDKKKSTVEQRLEEIKQQISSGKKPVGDNSLLPEKLESASESEISRQFGRQFLQALKSLQDNNKANNNWQGPLQSGLGLHFIKINGIEKGEFPTLDAVYNSVVNDWRYETSNKARTKFENQLLDRYQVKVAEENISPTSKESSGPSSTVESTPESESGKQT